MTVSTGMVRLYGKIKAKKEPITMLGFTSRLPCQIIILFNPRMFKDTTGWMFISLEVVLQFYKEIIVKTFSGSSLIPYKNLNAE